MFWTRSNYDARLELGPVGFLQYIVWKVNPLQKQHELAVDILAKLAEFNLDNIRLERQRDGYCVYYAWNVPILAHNGSKTIKRGRIRVPA
jgi:hypothetical protein